MNKFAILAIWAALPLSDIKNDYKCKAGQEKDLQKDFWSFITEKV